MSEPVFSVENLWVQANNGSEVLKGISLSVRAGEVVALIGESGSGKTTLSLTALGHIRPGLKVRHGKVHLDGDSILEASEAKLREIRGRKVAYVAQSAAAAFNPSMQLQSQVVESAIVHRTLALQEAYSRANDLFAALDLPDPTRIGRRYPHQVSGGQLQRFMAAMGLLEAPRLIILDEPTSALDVTTQVEVLKAFKSAICDGQTSALFVSHDLAVVAQMADRIVVLHKGSMVEEGSTSEILNNPQRPYTKQLIAAYKGWETVLASGRGPSQEPISGKSLLTGSDVHVRFGNVTAVDHVDFSVAPGEIVAVVGESGSGKSTLAQAIAGLVPMNGTLTLNGQPLHNDVKARTKKERQKIQIAFQMADTALNPRHTVKAILGRVIDFFVGHPKLEREARIAELLDAVHLPREYADRRSTQLSGGEKQRINLARTLAASPDVVICDEITSALDTVVVAAIVQLIKTLRDKLGITFIFISHDLATVATLADRILVMQKGKIVEQGATMDILVNPKHPYTKLLISSVPELRIGWLEDSLKARDRLGTVYTG